MTNTKTKSALVLHPEFNLYHKGNRVFCSSLQVADEFGKRHDHILADIEAINLPKSREIKEIGDTAYSACIENVAGFFKENFTRSTYTDSRGRKQPMYLMTEEGFTLLTMGYTGIKAMSLKVSIIKSFKAMQNFIRDYILAKDEFPIFTQAIADAYENPQPYHYSNEMNMIYRIVLGMDAKQFRDAHGIERGKSILPFLSEAQYRAVRKLQAEDIRMLYRGNDYQERKFNLAAKALPAKL